jgi:penicillin-binding protein 2
VVTPSTAFYCPGYVSLYGTTFHCAKAEGHGMVDVRRALQKSCNVYFYQIGVRLEIERIARYAKRMGLGAVTKVDLPHEAPGLIPTPEWKLRTQKTPWYAGETVSVAIGQGQVMVTPLQLARLAAAVASGTLVQPHLVRAKSDRAVEWPAPQPLGFRPETLEIVRDGLWAVVNEHGTGWRAQLPGLDVCGKTGSAQVVTRERLKRGPSAGIQPHAWFVAFAPKENAKIALCVLVEHGRAGAEAAAPVAREILQAFFRQGDAPAASGTQLAMND